MSIRLLFLVGLLVIATPTMAADSYTVTTGGFTTIDEHGVCRKVKSNSGSRMVPTKSAGEWTSFRNNATGVTMESCSRCQPLVLGGFCGIVMAFAETVADEAACLLKCENAPEVSCCTYNVEQKYCFGHLTPTEKSPYDQTAAKTANCTVASTPYGGYLWRMGIPGQTCTEVCTGYGGVNMAGTRDYVGSGGTNDNCKKVLEAIWRLDGSTYQSFSMSSVNYGYGIGCARNAINIDNNKIGYRDTSPTTANGDDPNGYSSRVCACNN